jgi:CheY-like chemotaxis protein
VPYAVFKVSDSGSGIPPGILDRIFDPFFTTKPQGKGTGLGLATVLGIVEGHGGFVLVDSRPGEGTVFQVFIPAIASAEQAGATEAAPALPHGNGELVLVVDDEAAILHMAEYFLKRNGYTTMAASTASQAMDCFGKQGGRIRAVLTDVMMPFGDGRQLIAMLREKDARLPIIAMSGLSTAEARQDLIHRGASTFLDKPFTAEQLLAVLKNTID